MEELRSCASQLMLQLGAGCTAPPPTPVRRPGPPAAADPFLSVCTDPFSSLSAQHHLDHTDVETSCSSAHGSGPLFRKPADIVDGDEGAKCNSLETMHRNSTPPSRAELDELALYLMQQSLLSPPTLLASPSSRRKQGKSPCSGAVVSNTAVSERASSQGGGGGKEAQRTMLMSGGGMSTYSYSIDGFCEEAKMSIRRVCKEEGAFSVLLTDSSEASRAQVINLYRQCPGVERMCLLSSGPLLPLCELMDEDPGTMSLGEDAAFGGLSLSLLTAETTTDADFREAMTLFTNLLIKISKELLKILLKDIWSETSINLRGCSIKPLLYMYKNGDQEAHVARHDGDLLLSIVFPSNANQHVTDNKDSILIVLGSQIQAWSKGKFKAPSLFSFCSLIDVGDVYMQLDLVYYV